MSNRSDRYIEKIMAFALGFSRVFGICNYLYDFKANRLTFPRHVVAYTIAFNILVAVLLPLTLFYNFQGDREQMSKNPVAVDIQRTIAVSHAATVCISFVWQWVNAPVYRTLFTQLTVVRTAECASLSRSSANVYRMIALMLLKLILSTALLFGVFASVYLRTDGYSVEAFVSTAVIVIVENVVLVVENHFYIGLLYCGFMFRMLNRRSLEVVQRILRTDRRRQHRSHLGVVMQICCSLCDDLDAIGKMHTDIYSLAMTITRLYGIQIFITIMATLTTQISLAFYAVIYLGENNTQVTWQMFQLSCTGLLLTTVNVGLMVYVCGTAVKQCNLPGEHLKTLNAVQRLDSRLEVKIEQLAFQMKHETLRISLCGLIDVDMSTGFRLLEAGLLNLVLLIQSDYKNL